MANTNALREEEIKNALRDRFFQDYDATPILGDVDFAVTARRTDPRQQELFEREWFLWAEAKRGTRHLIEHSLVQLIITIGKARTYLHHLPPAFLGAFDEEKIAFLPYYKVADIFAANDFNWNVAPSDHHTREFELVRQKVSEILKAETLVYHYATDERELRQFIRQNFIVGKSDLSRVRINKNNFTTIYQKWRSEVMPTIRVNWEEAKKQGVIAADFYLADILSEHNSTLLHRLYVLLRSDRYEFARRTDEATLFNVSLTAGFSDGQEAHRRFWNRYDRPPRREYWDYIVERRDLLVPQDVRERKGSFFTPQRWVELSQQYLADELGEDWQDRYYVWDCCAGTGNLLAGLTNRYNIYASTLDPQDVDVMRDRIQRMNAEGDSNLLENHVFQFDFLNDPLFDERDRKGRIVKKSKVPDSLQRILADPEERKRLVIYINPPYAEAGDAKQISGTGKNKSGVSFNNKAYSNYRQVLGFSARELFALFFFRVYQELRGCYLAAFSTLKIFTGPNLKPMREAFRAKLIRLFVVPANTFDNVIGQFPIGFSIWDTQIEEKFESVLADVYESDGKYCGQKNFASYSQNRNIIEWLRHYYDTRSMMLGYLRMNGTNFQNNSGLYFTHTLSPNDIKSHFYTKVTAANIESMCVYFAIRHCIEHTWLNHQDQFLYPNNGWETDCVFQTDCMVYSLFHGQNRISSKDGVNHWIPFREEEVGAQERFRSHFMSDYLSGCVAPLPVTAATSQGPLFDRDTEEKPLNNQSTPNDQNIQRDSKAPLDHLSAEAAAVMAAGRELWRYYHQQPNANPDASFYDIRLFFQGTKATKSGKEQMNPDSPDTTYTALLAILRQTMKTLAKRIEPKVYEYGFLK